MRRNLALSLRPQTFAQMIGQEGLTASIAKKYQSEDPPAWLFFGKTGTGKTTLARIIATSLNCEHGEMGAPCIECRRARQDFAVQEINAAELRGVEDMEGIVRGARIGPLPPSRKKIYILDEAHQLSVAAQNLLLKDLEDPPQTTTWIICTTAPQKLLDTIRSRCLMKELRLMTPTGLKKLLVRAYAFTKTEPTVRPMVDIEQALLRAKVQQPRLILNAVEWYLAGSTAADAVRALTTEINALAICRSLEKGDWTAIAKELKKATVDDLKAIRAQVAGYLQAMLLEDTPGPRATDVARAIEMVARVDTFVETAQGPQTCAALYNIGRLFAGPQETELENE